MTIVCLGEEKSLEAFTFARSAPGAFPSPKEVPLGSLDVGRAPVAKILVEAGLWKLGGSDLDEEDFFYRASFSASQSGVLRFEGIGGVAEIFLDGELVATSTSMYVPVEVPYASGNRELLVAIRSLTKKLGERRPRGKWKTKLTSHQQLRWFRQSLIGRMPGWSPTAPLLGLFAPVRRIEGPSVDVHTRPIVRGGTPVLQYRIVEREHVAPLVKLIIAEKEIGLQWGHARDKHALRVAEGEVALPGAAVWFPHSHGEPTLHALSLVVGESRCSLAPIGFRSVTLDTGSEDGSRGFQILVNDIPVFCRGATWTPDDLVAGVYGGESDALELLQRTNFNMVRISGTFTYESDAFYERCDALGILVFQDFMFANMDYPFADDVFRAQVTKEIAHQAARFDAHASLVVRCGGSEVFQQAAMLGIEPTSDTHAFFERDLPAFLESLPLAKGVHDVYAPSTPSGGALPFFANAGLTHYYGYGAYLRPLEDVRRANVRFATECLAFANVPEEKTLEELFGDEVPIAHHPLWKERVPRDRGTGWDFEDTRDHYFRELFAVDPIRYRSVDHPRYLQLSRAVSAYVVEQAYAEWRRPGSPTGGALVWFSKDLWRGAGWGTIDAAGRLKAIHWALSRAFKPRALFFTDEGLNGLSLHLTNDRDTPLVGRASIFVVRGDAVLTRGETAIGLDARTSGTVSVDALIGTFRDLTYAYRFGPLAHDAVFAVFEEEGATSAGETDLSAFYFPRRDDGRVLRHEPEELGLVGELDPDGVLRLRTTRLALYVRVDAGEATRDLSDNYFHLGPGQEKIVRGIRADSVEVSALNGPAEVRIRRRAAGAG